VKGPAASLISLEEKHFDKATALEIAAGGKLYNIVVEDEQVGTDLIKHGQLRKRITIIPLTKITAYKLPAKVIHSPSSRRASTDDFSRCRN
jgi:structural maintenance of chromosome 2